MLNHFDHCQNTLIVVKTFQCLRKHHFRCWNIIFAIKTSIKMITSLSSKLIATVFQINDYLNVFNFSYFIEKVEFLIIDIVNKRLKSTVLRQFISRIIQRIQFVELFNYLIKWAVNRDQLIIDIKIFVIKYKKWKKHIERAKSNTITSSRKNYLIDVISVHVSFVSFRLSLKRGALYDSIDSLILFNIKKFNKIFNVTNDFNDFNNSFQFNQHISTFLLIMFDDIDY